jgi:hypothetical protein
MKDKLGRDIMVGDTLAYCRAFPTHANYPMTSLNLAKVDAVSDFAIKITSIEDDNKPTETWVVSSTIAEYVICDWAKGSQVA